MPLNKGELVRVPVAHPLVDPYGQQFAQQFSLAIGKFVSKDLLDWIRKDKWREVKIAKKAFDGVQVLTSTWRIGKGINYLRTTGDKLSGKERFLSFLVIGINFLTLSLGLASYRTSDLINQYTLLSSAMNMVRRFLVSEIPMLQWGEQSHLDISKVLALSGGYTAPRKIEYSDGNIKAVVTLSPIGKAINNIPILGKAVTSLILVLCIGVTSLTGNKEITTKEPEVPCVKNDYRKRDIRDRFSIEGVQTDTIAFDEGGFRHGGERILRLKYD